MSLLLRRRQLAMGGDKNLLKPLTQFTWSINPTYRVVVEPESTSITVTWTTIGAANRYTSAFTALHLAAGTYKFTANAVAQAPAGASGGLQRIAVGFVDAANDATIASQQIGRNDISTTPFNIEFSLSAGKDVLLHLYGNYGVNSTTTHTTVWSNVSLIKTS